VHSEGFSAPLPLPLSAQADKAVMIINIVTEPETKITFFMFYDLKLNYIFIIAQFFFNANNYFIFKSD